LNCKQLFLKKALKKPTNVKKLKEKAIKKKRKAESFKEGLDSIPCA